MFEKEINDYAENLDGIRDFVSVVASFLEERNRRITDSRSEYSTLLKTALMGAVNQLQTKAALSEFEPSSIEEGGNPTARGDVEPLEKTVQLDVEETNSLSVSLDLQPDQAEEFIEAIHKVTRSRNQRHLLYRSALITLISTAEWFLAQVLERFIDRHPEAAGARDKFFSLEDLQHFDTIADARKHLVESKVEDIMRGSLEDWFRFLKEKPKLSMAYLDQNESDLVELFQRRNIVVHNGGIVNSIYLSKVSPEHRKELEIGQQLDITPAYLDKSVNLLELNFILIASELWRKLERKSEAREDLLHALGFRHLLAEKWQISEGIFRFLMDDKQLSEMSRLIAQVNYWQSLKWQGRFNEVSKAVEEADFSAKEWKFQLSRFALLEQSDGFFELLPRVLEAKQLSRTDLNQWPLFRTMREDDRFAEYNQEERPLRRLPLFATSVSKYRLKIDIRTAAKELPQDSGVSRTHLKAPSVEH